MTSSLPTPLISATELKTRLEQGQPLLLLDCSFDLAAPEAAERIHAEGHLPGARYVHLDRDLSGPKSPEGPRRGGRHPLPSREAFAQLAATWGLRPGLPVVVFDNQGSPYAARAWWMLNWIGHREVAVLDGGQAAWLAAGGRLSTQAPDALAATAPLPQDGPAGMPSVDADSLLADPGSALIVDARAGERFRGEVEPLDSRAGHIPGARHRFFKDNLAPDGRFLPADSLRQAFSVWGVAPERIVHQCGSGVTACHNLLAMAVAGLPGSRLYPGSWSEWSADPARPVAVGG